MKKKTPRRGGILALVVVSLSSCGCGCERRRAGYVRENAPVSCIERGRDMRKKCRRPLRLAFRAREGSVRKCRKKETVLRLAFRAREESGGVVSVEKRKEHSDSCFEQAREGMW